MDTVLKFDKYVLVKELNEKIRKVGDEFEIASILDYSAFVLREAKSKVAIGVVSFEDFENHFVPVENFKGWTDWIPLVGFDGQTDAFYRTNRKKVQVKFLTNKVRAEACCHRDNEFSLFFGIQMAYLRCLNKSHKKRMEKLEAELKAINSEVAENETIMKKMINNLEI